MNIVEKDMNIVEKKVDGQSVYYVDNLLDDAQVGDLSKILQKLSFTKSEISHPEDEYLSFKVEFTTDNFDEKVIVGRIAENLIRELYPAKPYRLFRAYLNMSNFGDVEYPHRDCDVKADNITVLYYAHSEWDRRWGGETFFYDGQDVALAISPRPGRFLIFPGAIEHTGTVPTRICKSPRFSLVMKYKLAQQRDDRKGIVQA